jgi:aspartokinase-like uncharacterized kinase
MRSSLAVVKVGGSLFDWPELPRRMTAFIDARRAAEREEQMVLIAGGGPVADAVRVLDRIHGLGNETAHRVALHALDFTTFLLAALVPGTVAVERIDALRAVWAAGSIPVLAPRAVLSEIDRSGQDALPASWDVTSDTIAARIASHLAADRLILLKSAPLPSGAARQDAARLGLVDPMLPVVAQALPRVEYMNLREQTSQPHLLPL